MHRWRPLLHLVRARLLEFFREPEAIFWVYGFPLILAVGLGIAFSTRGPESQAVDVQETPAPTEAHTLTEQLRAAGMDAQVHSEAECKERLRIGKTTLYVVPDPHGYRYVYDPARTFAQRVNLEMVDVESLDESDVGLVRSLVERHGTETESSVSATLLESWDVEVHEFVKVMPRDYRRIMEATRLAEAQGRSVDEAVMEAAHG